MFKNPRFLFLAAATGLAAAPCHAAISYTTLGGTLGENFDGLTTSGTSQTWTNNSTLSGWYAQLGGVDAAAYRGSSGASAFAGELLSLGPSGNSDRALGSQTQTVNGNTATIAVTYQNNTGVALTQLSLNYTGETWRDIAGQPGDGFVFQYQVFDSMTGTINAASGWTTVAALDYTGSSNSAAMTNVGVNGNDPANRTALSATVSGVSWGAGQEIWFRWTDKATAQNAVGVEDFSFSAVPEPSAALLGALGTLALLRRKRL